MKFGTCFLYIKKLGMILASHQARKKNLIAILIRLIEISSNKEMSQKRLFLGNRKVLAMY